MSAEHLYLLFGDTAAVVYADIPEGKPSTITSMEIRNNDDSDTATAESALGAPSVEAISLTLSAAAGSGQSDPTLITLAAGTTAAMEGRILLLTDADTGEEEYVEVDRVDTANHYIYSRVPLRFDYVTGDTLTSFRASATVDSTWIADTGNLSNPLAINPRFRVRVAYRMTGDTTDRVIATYLDVVRYPRVHSVNPLDVDAYAPGWLDRLPTDDRRGQGERLITEAFRRVKEEFAKRNIADYALRNSEFLNRSIVRMAAFVGAEAAFLHGGIGAEQVRYLGEQVESYLNEHAALAHQQVTSDGAAGPIVVERFWKR